MLRCAKSPTPAAPAAPPRQGHRIFSVAGVLLLTTAVLSFAVYQLHCYALRYLSRSLTESAGMPVVVESLHGGLAPDFAPVVVIEGIRVGGAGEDPLLSIQRAEASIVPHLNRRPSISRVRLIRPRLRIDRKTWEEAPRALRRVRRQQARPQRRARRNVELLVEDGKLEIAVPMGTQSYSVVSRGVYLRPSSIHPDQLRLVLGRTTVSRGGDRFLELAATSADLDPAAGFRPTRIASLGGVISSPTTRGGALLIHTASLQQRLNGYLLKLDGKPLGRSTGRIQARAKLDLSLHLQETAASELPALALAFHDVDLSTLAPHLERVGIDVGTCRLNGRLSVSPVAPGRYTVDTSLAARGLGLQHAMVSGERVGPLDGHIEGTMHLDSKGVLEMERLVLRSGAVRLNLKGILDISSQLPKITIEVEMPEASCQDLLASLPVGFAPKLNGMALKGKLGLTSKLKLDAADLEHTEVDLTIAPLGCTVLVDPPMADVNALKRELTISVSGANGERRSYALGRSNADFHPLSRISRHIKSAFIVAEDSRFYRHDGFDKKQLKRAFVTNLQESRVRRGASTISQQVVKNVFLHHKRTFSRKFQEAVLTWRMEQVIPKKRILELYLNLVEMGPGVYGVGQATRHYFGRPPRRVTPLQAAHLAALTPSPRYFGQRFRDGDRPGQAWKDKLSMLLRMMRRRGTITRAEQKRWSATELSLNSY
jgi:Transglycosylase